MLQEPVYIKIPYCPPRSRNLKGITSFLRYVLTTENGDLARKRISRYRHIPCKDGTVCVALLICGHISVTEHDTIFRKVDKRKV